jgi:hypothetical protein
MHHCRSHRHTFLDAGAASGPRSTSSPTVCDSRSLYSGHVALDNLESRSSSYPLDPTTRGPSCLHWYQSPSRVADLVRTEVRKRGSFRSNANKTLTLGFEGLTSPPSTESAIAASREAFWTPMGELQSQQRAGAGVEAEPALTCSTVLSG